MKALRQSIRRSTSAVARLAGEEGQGLVEYALVLLFVAVALVGALTGFGSSLSGQYQAITSTMASL
jgi:pilus assembly protein Flp/PilA